MAPRLKLIDTWIYKYEGLENPDGGDEGPGRKTVREKVVEVELRLIKESEESQEAPHSLRSVKFEVSCKKPQFKIVGTDIEALRLAAWAELDEEFAIKWERYFLVRVDPTRPYGLGIGTGLNYSYETIDKGTAHDGTLLLREMKPHEYKYVVKPWPGEFKDSRGHVMACIPATPENEAALEQFTEAVHATRRRIADYLRPDTIQQTLANLANVRLALAGPNARDED